MSKTKPITRKIRGLLDDSHVGWVLYVEDYERAVRAMWQVLYPHTDADKAYKCARAALKAIGIVAPKKAKESKKP